MNILAGSTVSHGSQPRVAVEGYAGTTLAGGVVVDAVAPNYVLFDGHLRQYLPIVRRGAPQRSLLFSGPHSAPRPVGEARGLQFGRRPGC